MELDFEKTCQCWILLCFYFRVYLHQPPYWRPHVGGHSNRQFEQNARSQSPQVWQISNSYQQPHHFLDEHGKVLQLLIHELKKNFIIVLYKYV